MTDHRLRTLERRAATGGIEDRARLLRGRVRAGEVTQERLELAAYLGDEGARRLLGPLHPDHPRWIDAGFFTLWTQELPRWDQAPVRAAVAAAWEAFHSIDRSACDVDADTSNYGPTRCLCGASSTIGCIEARNRIRHAIESAERWITDPSEKNLYGAIGAAGGAHVAIAPWADFVLLLTGTPRGDVEFAAAGSARLTSEARVRAAIQSDLVPWALGERDPVRQRVDERRGT